MAQTSSLELLITAWPLLRSTALATNQPSALVVPEMQSKDAPRTAASAACKSLPVPRIAIDCGNVISITHDGSKNLSAVMKARPSEDCVKAIATIVRTHGAPNVFVLSKCHRPMQQAVTIMFGKSSFFERTGMLPTNVLFCTLRSGGKPLAEEEMRLLESPADYGVFSGHAEDFVQGPRYAPGDVGKGAMAITFRLTSLIDDCSECLFSFYFEGLLRKQPDAGILLQALWGKKVTPSLRRRDVGCHCWNEVLSHLHEHHSRSPALLGQRAHSEAASTHSGESDIACSASIASSSDAHEETRLFADAFLLNAIAEDVIESPIVDSTARVNVAKSLSTSASCGDSDDGPRLYSCAECGESPLLGAFDEDEVWYCKACWEDLLAVSDAEEAEGTSRRDDQTRGAGASAESSPDSTNEDWERQYTCADCGMMPPLGAIDETDGKWYCKECWETLLSSEEKVIE